MITLRFEQLAAVTGGVLDNSALADRLFRGVSIDSRSIHDGELFVALRGERHDGHNFVTQAIAAGAAGAVVERPFTDRPGDAKNVPLVVVRNSHEAMIRLALDYRDRVAPVRIGITGSNGKTTTKELMHQLLQAVTSNVYRSPGNYNNLYGMPLALLAMPQDTTVAVLEMGISQVDEMTRLAEIAKPDVVVFTNVGPSHLEFLKTTEGVARAKLEAVKGMTPDQPIVANADDAVLIRELSRLRRDFVTFGLSDKAQFHPSSIEPGPDGSSRVRIDSDSFHLSLFGAYQVYNLLAAYATVRTLGYSFEQVDTEGLLLESVPMRGERIMRGAIHFIADCYNANPDSVGAGLKTFGHEPVSGRKVVILGDMLELGTESEYYHRQVGKLLPEWPFDLVALVGPMSRYAYDEALASGLSASLLRHYETAAACATEMKDMLHADDTVYLKGSRGIGLEAVLSVFESEGGRD